MGLYNPADMYRPRHAHLAPLATAALILSAASLHGASLVIGVPVQEDGLTTTGSWALICRQAQSDSGCGIRSVVLKDSEAALDELKRRFIDLALVDPAWYWQRRDECAPLLEARSVAPAEASVSLIVPRTSIYYKASDLAGKAIALTRPRQGAAGFYVPLAMLAEAGASGPGALNPIFADTFESILKGIAFESLEAGALPSSMAASPAGAAYSDFIRVIAVSEPLPQLLVVVRAGEDPSRYDDIAHTLMGLSETEPGRRALESAGLSRFVPVEVSGFTALNRYLEHYRRAYEASE